MKEQIEELKRLVAAHDERGAMALLRDMTATATTPEDKAAIDDLAKALLTDARTDLEAVQTETEALLTRDRLGELSEAINLSYIARVYFGKSRSWLHQRLNGNKVNGREVRFTPEEQHTFLRALDDIGSRIASLHTA